MTVKDVHKDPATLTMTVTAEFDAGVDRVWQLWADPRKLERWWGPPTFPATFVRHELEPGGTMSYFMTGPEGDQHHGWWKVIAVDAPTLLEVEDGFGDADGNHDDSMPVMRMQTRLAPVGTRTVVTIETRFGSLDDMDRVISMGMEEGLREAMGQMDAILAE